MPGKAGHFYFIGNTMISGAILDRIIMTDAKQLQYIWFETRLQRSIKLIPSSPQEFS